MLSVGHCKLMESPQLHPMLMLSVNQDSRLTMTGLVNGLKPYRLGAVASMKRLLFESQTQLLALLKEQVTSPDPNAPKKVPNAERESRLVNLRARLTGVLVEGHSEPDHSLVDAACHMYEQNQLRYIPLEKCFSRLAELTATSASSLRSSHRR